MASPSRRQVLAGGLGAVALGALGGTPAAQARPLTERISRAVIRRWAADTWASLVAMTDERTGLTADNIQASVRRPVRSGYTSPTNIGGYLWSAIVARDLGLISRGECSVRIARTLRTLARMDRHDQSGQFYNWYDESDASVLLTWPVDGTRVYPFLSSVDNGWLAAALMVVRNADRANSRRAGRLLDSMNFGMYYNPNVGTKSTDPAGGFAGLLKGGFWDGEPKPREAIHVGNFLGGPNVNYTGFHYDTTVSETRIASYIAIARGQVPPRHYFGTYRTFPTTFDWQEQRPVGETRTYEGIPVFEGAYSYRGMLIVPGWGGSMFEALMPNMFVPEERWAPQSWGVNHPLTVRAHREHGLDEARYGYWGFSPASDPRVINNGVNGYREYGVDAIGLNPDGYFSDVEKTNYDIGYAGVRPATKPSPNFGDGVVTPHALFLAMHHEPQEAYENLRKLQRQHYAYGQGGFYDAIAVESGTVARRYLSLDQAMVMGSIGNVFGGDIIRRAFCAGEIRAAIRPLIAQEQFGAGLL
jgi:Putative glucoamylase/Protein of unknown function (DUF3131)